MNLTDLNATIENLKQNATILAEIAKFEDFSLRIVNSSFQVDYNGVIYSDNRRDSWKCVGVTNIMLINAIKERLEAYHDATVRETAEIVQRLGGVTQPTNDSPPIDSI